MPGPDTAHRLVFSIVARAPRDPALGDIGLFLYDLSTLYDLLRLALDPRYDHFRFGKYPLYRGRRPLEPEDQLIVDRVEQGSILGLQAHTGVQGQAAAVARMMTGAVESIYGLSLDWAGLDRELGRLETGAGQRAFDKRVVLEQAAAQLEQRGAQSHVDTIIRRLKRSPVKITSFTCNLEQT